MGGAGALADDDGGFALQRMPIGLAVVVAVVIRAGMRSGSKRNSGSNLRSQWAFGPLFWRFGDDEFAGTLRVVKLIHGLKSIGVRLC